MRLVVFAGPALDAVDQVLFARLARDSRFTLCAVIVDERPPAPAPARGRRLLDRLLARRRPPLSRTRRWGTFARDVRVPVHHVPGAGTDRGRSLIRSLGADLGLVLGGAVPPPLARSIPSRGTVAVERGRGTEGDGESPVGYRELLEGEAELRVAVRWFQGTGPAATMTEASIPIEPCETLESLGIKAAVGGARLLHESLGALAMGTARASAAPARRVDPAPSPGDVTRLERDRRRLAAQMPLMRRRPFGLVRLRLLAQYLALLPGLRHRRRRLARAGRAPVAILFYHSVANRPLNHMALPLEEFVRQVEFLRARHQMMSLDAAVERLGTGVNERVGVALTFDDGYRDNVWAIEYLRYFEVPVAFFVSIGHVLHGRAFEHDRRQGFEAAAPMEAADVKRLARDGFLVGSHGIDHEDFGRLAPAIADRVLTDSRRLIGEVTGREPEHFSFPFGQRGVHITPETYALAEKHYRCVYSAYGGYNFPEPGQRHFVRICHPVDVASLAMIMDGYTGLRACLTGDAWGLATHGQPPY